MKKLEKVVWGFCLLFLTSLISFSLQKELHKNPIPVPPDQGRIICDDLTIDHGPPLSPVWQSRHSRKYCGMVAGDFDGDGYHEIAVDFGSLGIWIYDPNAATAWNRISYDDPEWMIAIAISSTADDELLVKWVSASTSKNSWWNYSGYPGIWNGFSGWGFLIDYAYDAGDVNGDGDHEVVIQWDGKGIYVYNYTGSASNGGFTIYRISSTEGEGFPIQFGDANYELLHRFWRAVPFFWYYSSGYSDRNWRDLRTCGYLYINDSVAADVDGDTNTTDELMAAIYTELWLYDRDTATWTRLNFNKPSGIYPVAYDLLDEQYEFLMKFSGVAGLWAFDPDITTAGVRVNWNQPEYVLGADFRTYADGGNNGEEVIADFGPLGVWIQLQWTGSWTRINWTDSEAMIKANLDADPEMEIVFDFGSKGVWLWDGAGSGTWTRISYIDPEFIIPAGCDEYDRR